MQNEKCKGECLKGLLPMPQVLHLMVVYHGKILLSTHITKNISISGELSKKKVHSRKKCGCRMEMFVPLIYHKNAILSILSEKREQRTFTSSVL